MERAIHEPHRGLSAGYPGRHTHVHGVVGEQLTTTARGLAALKWSFLVLAIGSDLPQVPARWIGHRLYAEADIAIDPRLSVGEGIELARRFELAVTSHLPEIRAVHVGIRAAQESSA